MVSTYDRGLLLVAIGVVLVLNPVYLYPNGGPTKRSYQLESEPLGESPTVRRYNEHGASILDCTGYVDKRACLFERHVGPNGTFVVDNQSALATFRNQLSVSADYAYVNFATLYYEPRVSVSNGSAVVSLKRVGPTTVAHEIAVPYRDTPPVVQRAVDNGSASMTVSVLPREEVDLSPGEQLRYYLPAIIQRGDQYFGVRVTRHESRRFFLAKYLPAVHAVGALVGFTLIVMATQLPGTDDS